MREPSEPSEPAELSEPSLDPTDQLEQLDQLETDLDTVEGSLAALDADNLDQAEALANSLSETLTETLTGSGGQSDESTNEV